MTLDPAVVEPMQAALRGTAPGQTLAGVATLAGAATQGTASLQDTGQTDYAAEVGRLIAAAQHPLPIGVGVVAGIAAGYGVGRLRGHRHGMVSRFGLPALTGLVAGTFTHGGVSWLMYRHKGPAGLADAGTPTATTGQQTPPWVQHIIEQQWHPVAIGAGIGGTLSSGYALWKWRNPPGTKHHRWGIPLVGAIIVGGMARTLTASLLPAAKNSSEVNQLTGLTDFTSIGSTVVSAMTILCLYGGAKYLYDSWSAGARRGGRARSTPATSRARGRHLSDPKGESVPGKGRGARSAGKIGSSLATASSSLGTASSSVGTVSSSVGAEASWGGPVVGRTARREKMPPLPGVTP